MNTRYKVIISNASLYTEFEISGSVPKTRIGTGIDCDCRMHKDLFFEPIGLTLTNSDDNWEIFCDDNLYIDVGDVRKLVTIPLEHGKVFNIKYRASNNLVFTVEFLIDFFDGEQSYERKINIADADSIRIGTNPQNDIVLKSRYLTADDNIELVRRQNGYALRIFKTTHGVYRNGSKVESGIIIQNGDFFSMADISFYYKRGVLWTSASPNISVKSYQYKDKANLNNYPKFTRNTRVKSGMNDEVIEILDPPAKPEKPKANLLTKLLPSVGMLAAAGVMAMMGGSTMIIMSGISGGMAIITAIIGVIQGNKEFKEKSANRIEKYTNYITRKREEIEAARKEEFDTRNETYIHAEQELAQIHNFSSNLFDRISNDDDFVHVRLGYGSLEAVRKINVKKQERLEIEDELQQKPQELSDTFKYIENMPIICDFKSANGIGIVGDAEDRYSMMKNIVLDIVARQYYTDVKLFFVATEENRDKVELFRFLPYAEMNGTRTIVSNSESKTLIFEFLYKELSQREAQKLRSPKIVVFFYDEYNFQNHPLAKFNGKAAELGVTFVFLNKDKEKIPQGCEYIIDVKNSTDACLIDTGDKRNNTDFTYTNVSDIELKSIVSILAPVYTEEVSLESALTKNISMYEMLNIFSADDIDLEKNWSSSHVDKSMAAPLGVSTGGMVYLDLHDKFHGPHGLVAGTTGSGKSEVLQTYILSMATLFHPYEVGFVIIDFKGGGMVNQFRDLPHLMGAITNIDGKAIDRSLKSIKAELKKRQRLFAEADVNHIDKYIKKYKAGEVSEALPHLILIVDEFAELKAEQPEFMKELISAARIGRSLGVHLILATQKPSGQVDDQIWSNSRFKLCLKVQTQQDSNEVLKSPLAAEIKEPGRAYLQVGNNEIFELFQSAYSGAPSDTSSLGQLKEFDIYSVSPAGKRQVVYKQRNPKCSSENALTQLDAIVKYVHAYCIENQIAKLPDICLPALPTVIELPLMQKKDPLKTVVNFGLYDDPDNQLQDTYQLDLSLGNAVLIGSSQSGKTNAIQTIIRGLAEQYSPKEVTMYVIDFNSMILKNFEKMVHVGGVVTSAEDEALKNLFKLLLTEIAVRKEKLLSVGVSSFNSYREAGKKDLPHIVLFIDNITALRELYLQDNDVLLEICKEGPSVGITVVAANAQTSGFGYRYLSFFTTRIALFCNDSGEYNTIFDHCRTSPDNTPGRCLIVSDKRHLECQIYQAFEAEKEFQRVEKMHNFVDRINKQYVSVAATAIPVVPKVLTEELAMSSLSAPLQPYQIYSGLDYADVEPVIMDLTQLGMLAISGRKGMGKSNFIHYMLKTLERNRQNAPVNVCIIDSFERRFADLQGLDIVTEYSLLPEKALETISQWTDELQARYDALVSGDIEAIRKAPLLLLIIQNNDVAEAISANRTVLDQYKNFFSRFKALKVAVIYSNFENAAIQYSAPDAVKMLRDNQQFLFFDDLSKFKAFDISITTIRQFKKQIDIGDCYCITENGVAKMKSVLTQS